MPSNADIRMHELEFCADVKSAIDSLFAAHPEWPFSHAKIEQYGVGNNKRNDLRVFRKGDQVCGAAWTTGRVPRTAPIPVEGACDVISHTGEHLPPPPVLRGEAQLALTEAPRYLLYTRA